MNPDARNTPGQRQTMRLLRTKLFVPPPHPARVERAALLARLVEGLAGKLVLVSAPAGSGKTTLVSAGLQRSGLPASWVSLDGRDNDPARFWTYFVAGVQTLFPALAENALAMLQSPQPPPIETILTELLNEIADLEGDFIVVLDDYHVIEADAIHQALTFLLENQAPQMHLVIATRSDPPLPLPLLEVRRELVRIGPSELRFEQPEAEAFFNQVMRMDLSREQVAELQRVTEGWVAGLHLAALSLQAVGDASRFIRSFSGGHRYVLDYLAQEVLYRQPSHLQDFLLKTSILERMCGSLCDQVIGSREPQGITAQAMLEHLEKAQLFIVPLDHERRWYRYHHLFREFLQAQLVKQAAAEEIRRLHSRASRWYETQSLISEAIHHALQAEDHRRVAGLIDDIAVEMFQRSELATLHGWLKQLPTEFLQERPRLRAVLAWVLLATSQTEQMEELLEAMENDLGGRADGSPDSFEQPAEVRGVLAEIACFRSSMAFNRMDLQAVVQNSERARAYLTPEVQQGLYTPATSIRNVASFNLALAHEFSGRIRAAEELFREAVALSRMDNNLHLLPMAYSHLANLQVIQGQLHAARGTYHEAMEAAESAGRPSPLAGMAYTGLGNLLVEWNQLDEAEKLLQQGLSLGRQWHQWEILITGYFGLARIYLARNRVKEAKIAVDDLALQAKKFHMHLQDPQISAYQAWVRIHCGEIEPALAWLETSSLDIDAEILFFQEDLALQQAQLLIAVERLEAGERLLNRLVSGTQAGGRTDRLIRAQALRAVARYRAGRSQPALEDLAAALAQAEPQDYVRAFLDQGPPMQALLESLRSQPERAGLQNYIDRLLSGFAETQHPAPKAEPTTDLLSERELEVLKLLAQGLTNQEIAGRLYVSVNTVKTHVKGVYNALDVRNRTEAAARAQELGLLE